MASFKSTAPVERLCYTVDEARAATGLGRTFFYELMKSGKLAYTQVGDRRLIAVAALKALVGAAQ
jgi:excisionase family DNA binding protein